MSVRHFGLGLLVGAVLHSELLAQVRDTTREVRVPIPAREDSLLQRDSLLRRDSTRAANPPKDTIKAPLATAEPPVLADPGGSFVWNRKDLFSTGALTVQDLLDRVPGATGFRSGWMSQPLSTAFMGDMRRVRIFLDGLELEELDPRAQRVWDLTQIPLWALDDIRVERVASEMRIHLRTWRVERTTPFTRTDIYTGDQSTNLYRGLFGRRYHHGESLQLAGQQYGTNPGRTIEGSDQLSVLARVGIARSKWSADAFLLRGDRNRGRAFTSSPRRDTVPATESSRSDAYVRLGWGTPERGLWMQGIANASKYAFGGQTSTNGAVSADTARFRSQYVFSGGYAGGPWRASFTQRYRVGIERRFATPSVRLGFDTRFLAVSAFAEGRGLDSTRRFDVSAVLRPLDMIYLAGSVGGERPKTLPDFLLTATSPSVANFARAEGGIRIRDLWFSAGVLQRDAIVLHAPTIFNRTTPTVVDSSRQGVSAAIRGRIWKSVHADVNAIQWSDSGGPYRPKYQTRSELFVSTSLLDRFPSGNFHLLASVVHEYRSSTLWPDTTGVLRVSDYRTISTLLQVRILSAEVFWNFRNIMRERYNQIPGYVLPRGSNIYGVRWEFWN